MKTKPELMNYTEEELKLRKRSPSGYKLGDLVNFERIIRKLSLDKKPFVVDKKVEVIRTVDEEDQYSYIDDNLTWITQNQCRIVLIPPKVNDVAVLKNWIWYRGEIENCESLGIVNAFMINLTFARVPCLIVKSSMVSEMNDRCHGAGHDMYKERELTQRPRTPLNSSWYPDWNNTYFCKEFTIDKWVRNATNPFRIPYLNFILNSGLFEPASVQFRIIPRTGYSMSPLIPTPNCLSLPSVDTRECSISSWGLFDGLYVVQLDSSN